MKKEPYLKRLIWRTKDLFNPTGEFAKMMDLHDKAHEIGKYSKKRRKKR